MFRDAAQLDRQHTASSFEAAMAAYTKQAESWFDGGVGSIDKRLAQCQRLLHAARATTARMDIAHSGRYLKAAESLKADQETLQDLRHALLTGAADREEVVGPPGWKAKHRRTDDQKDGDLNTMNSGFFNRKYDVLVGPNWGHPKPHEAGLTKEDRRWVELESARFVSANTDCLDNNHELATRAHHHAAIKTSTFTPRRSAQVCEAFVAEVSALGKQMYRPPARTAARSFDNFPDQAIYL